VPSPSFLLQPATSLSSCAWVTDTAAAAPPFPLPLQQALARWLPCVVSPLK
ncbi:hypothetical protein NDU88_006120, partial [Pleurodeles waltl]